MNSMSDVVLISVDGHILKIQLNRPEARNAINGAVAQGISAAIDQLEEREDLRVAVLEANISGHKRPVFCAGADLKVVNDGKFDSLLVEGSFAGITYRKRTKPIIAAVNGLATAGGCEIALSCDIILASRSAAFGLAEVMRGLIAGAGGLFRLPLSIGRQCAMDAILTGEPVSAERGYQLGLVSRLFEDNELKNEAMNVAVKIAANAPLAVTASRDIVSLAGYADEEYLIDRTEILFRQILSSDDVQEGTKAFIEKRNPNWRRC